MDRETGVAKALDDALAKAAIDEELGGLFLGTRHRRELYGAASLPHDSGGRSGCEPDYVLDLIGRDAEVRCNLGDGVAGLKPIDEILYASAAVGDDREAKCDPRVDDHFRVAVSRQSHGVCPAVASVMDALQIVIHNPGELALLGANDDQIHYLALATLVRVVEENLGSICIEALGGECVIDADLLFQDLYGGSNPLQRHPGSPETRQHEGLGEADEGHRRLSAVWRKAGDQRMLGFRRSRPALDVRLRHVEIASRFAQREDRAGEPGIVCPEMSPLSRVSLDQSLPSKLRFPLLSIVATAAVSARWARPKTTSL